MTHHIDEVPALATLSTSAVAELLGITEQAVSLKMSRAGVLPVARQIGRGGKNLYPRAAALAMLKTEAPAPSTVIRSEFKVQHSAYVELAEPVEYLDQLHGYSVLVKRVSLDYTNTNQHQPEWHGSIKLHGPRVLKSGAAGAEVTVHLWPTNREFAAPELEFARRELALHAPDGYDPA